MPPKLKTRGTKLDFSKGVPIATPIQTELTPEEQAQEQRLSQGQKFISERERFKAELMARGLTEKQAARAFSEKLDVRQQELKRQLTEIESQLAQQPTAQAPQLIPQQAGEINISPEEKQETADEIGGVFPEDTTIGRFERAVNVQGEKLGAGSLVEERQAITTPILRSTARIIDAAVSIFSQKRQVDVVAAEGALNDVMSALDNDVKQVQAGIKSAFEVRQGVQRAELFIDRLEGTQKGLGKANLRYWITDGKEVEAKIILEKENLEDIKRALLIAEQQAQANRQNLLTEQARLRQELSQ